MEALAVDLLLLRSLLTPEIKIVPGRALMARVVTAEAQGGKGALSIAGMIVDAELPKEVKAGQDIRLVVKEVTQQRVVLSMSDQPTIAPPPAAVELPGGGTIRLTTREESSEEGGGGPGPDGSHTISVRYDAPALGAVDLRFDLDPSSLRVSVSLGAGKPFELGDEASDQLRDALAEEAGRAVTVVVTPRREPLDVYA
jgi:hypothetical protein